MTKTAAFKLMPDHLFMNSSNKLLQRLSGAQMQSRWRTQMARYRQTREAAHQRTGFGLEEDEIADNMTLKEKLNAMCPEYERMDELFGERPNIQPACTLELGLPPEAQPKGNHDQRTADDASRERDHVSGLDDNQDLSHCDSDNSDISSHNEEDEDAQELTVIAITEGDQSSPSELHNRNDSAMDYSDDSGVEKEMERDNEDKPISPDLSFEPSFSILDTDEADLITSSVRLLDDYRGASLLDGNPGTASNVAVEVPVQSQQKRPETAETEMAAANGGRKKPRYTTEHTQSANGKRRRKSNSNRLVPDHDAVHINFPDIPQTATKNARAGNTSRAKPGKRAGNLDDKPKRTTANDRRMWLLMEYAKNGERKHEVMSRKLDLEERKWRAEQHERELQRRLKYEQRNHELANRAVSQRHELFLGLF
ncbi:hypothetical protein DVH05_023277 [Phytophthora capsici]|nr:hypothetical protein DVH05_018109 [Phytophthora capsici]KAG1693512.1 hypothetical protein DVH05_023277 [Phytophthora capsici]